jgi:hypothetical protein
LDAHRVGVVEAQILRKEMILMIVLLVLLALLVRFLLLDLAFLKVL